MRRSRGGCGTLNESSNTGSYWVQVKETVRDVHFLHNEQFFAVAQRKYVYIYDKRGIEVHRLKVRRSLFAQPYCVQV